MNDPGALPISCGEKDGCNGESSSQISCSLKTEGTTTDICIAKSSLPLISTSSNSTVNESTTNPSLFSCVSLFPTTAAPIVPTSSSSEISGNVDLIKNSVSSCLPVVQITNTSKVLDSTVASVDEIESKVDCNTELQSPPTGSQVEEERSLPVGASNSVQDDQRLCFDDSSLDALDNNTNNARRDWNAALSEMFHGKYSIYYYFFFSEKDIEIVQCVKKKEVIFQLLINKQKLKINTFIIYI